MGKVLAIDGPSGAGKSTIARMLADKLGFEYLDTGALYRATALGLVRAGLNEDATDEDVATALRDIRVEFFHGAAHLNGEDVSGHIRTPEAGHFSSVFSARASVRDSLMPVQRQAAENADLVAEGRDMGTVVFPDAWKKFFLVASVEARALRRFNQMDGTDGPITMDEAMRDVVERDERDSSRDIAPLRKADDAMEVDSSHMSIEQVIGSILDEVRK